MNFRYINTKNIYPFDTHIINGLKEIGHNVLEVNIDDEGIRKYFILAKKVLTDKNKYDATFIGFPSPLFAIIVGFICVFDSQKIIFNAVFSQYEANVLSRGIKKYSLVAIKYWIIDFISFHLAWKILLESNAQKKYVHNLVFVSKTKLVRSFSGINEKEFFYIPNITKQKEFTVLFRGRFLPESGIDTVIKTAHILETENINFRIIGLGHMYREVNSLMANLKPKNIEMITKPLPIEELRIKMLECHISLGQLANHPRLARTLPCKLFESLSLGLPYLTGRNEAVFELLEENETCFAIEPGNPYDLAKKILYLRDNTKILQMVATNGYKLFKEKLTSTKLTKDIINNCFKK